MNPRLRWALVLISAGLAVALTVSLGFWQLRRAAQKEAVAQAMQVGAQQPSLSAGELLEKPVIEQWVHHSVQLTGHWLPQQTVYLDNRQMQAKVGFFVLTPFRVAGSSEVLLVQRGWVPRNFLNRNQLPEVHTPEGSVSFRGRIALPPSKLYELGGATTGPIRQNLDMQAYRQESGLPIRTDFSVLQLGEASEGLLREWPLIQLGIDKHYGYALQWFAIAALVSGLLVWFLVRPLLVSSKKDSSHV